MNRFIASPSPPLLSPPLPSPLDANVALTQVEDVTKPIGWHMGLLAVLLLGGCCLIVFLARRRGKRATRASAFHGGGRTGQMPEIALGSYPLGGDDKMRQPSRVKWQPSPAPNLYPPPGLEKQGSSYEDVLGSAMLDAMNDGRNGAAYAAAGNDRRSSTGSLIEGL